MQQYLNDIPSELLVEVKRLSGLFFIPKEIALMLEYNVADFCDGCQEIGSKLYNAYQGGRLQGQVDLRTSILKMAKAGSSPAQTMALGLLNDSKILMMENGS